MSQKVKYNGTIFERRHLAAAQMAKDMLSLGDPLMRRLATGALSHLGQGEALRHCQDFVSALKDQDRGVRYCAVVYLAFARSFSGPSPVQEHTAEVAELLKDEDPGIRYWALETLANQGFASQPQAQQLLAALEDIDPHCRLAAAKAVAKVTPDDLPQAADVLVRSLDIEEPEIFRKSAAEGLGYMGIQAMKYLPRLVQVLTDRYALARAAACGAIGQLGAEAVQQCCRQLAPCLEDEDLDVRLKASEALQLLDLPTALASPVARLRWWGAEQAFERPDVELAEALASLLQDETKEVRAAAAWALSALGETAAEYMALVTSAVKDEHPDVWPPILRIISRHLPEALPESLGEVVQHVTSSEAHRRLRAIEALGAARDASLPYLEPVVKALEDEDVTVRLASMEALHCAGKRGVRKGDKVLAKLVKEDPDSQVRREALALLRHYMIAGKFGLDGVF
ncbi:unnamed protein product [Durusdinium trenchii]|uniref:HEAT repeat domain-containing protein n=2 Tax=Durusdinium trenchii TaxID=1381693 RepID=A0ABP0N557_9DINO